MFINRQTNGESILQNEGIEDFILNVEDVLSLSLEDIGSSRITHSMEKYHLRKEEEEEEQEQEDFL